MELKSALFRVLTYCGYVISAFNVVFRWFIMGSPLFRGLKVGYWGETTYSDALGKRMIEVEKFEAWGISRSIASSLNFALTYFHMAIISVLFLTFIFRIYQRIKLGKQYTSRGYYLTGILGTIVLLYMFVLKVI